MLCTYVWYKIFVITCDIKHGTTVPPNSLKTTQRPKLPRFNIKKKKYFYKCLLLRSSKKQKKFTINQKKM